MTIKKQKFTKEFKLETLQLANQSGTCIAQLARDLGIRRKRPKNCPNGGGNSKKGEGLLQERKELRFKFIDLEAINYPIRILCKCMKVSKSGYYYWKTKPISTRSKQNNQLVWKIIQIFKNSKKNYGSPRIYKELRRQDISISLNKVARLMHRNNIYAHYSAKHKKAKIAISTSGFAFNILNSPT